MITITPRAIEYIKNYLMKKNGMAFRLSIKKTGCSGYTYAPSIVHERDEIKTQDEIVMHDGIKIIIDASWLHLLKEVQIDYIEEEKAGLKQKRLLFTNPNEKSRCGCGESFHVE